MISESDHPIGLAAAQVAAANMHTNLHFLRQDRCILHEAASSGTSVPHVSRAAQHASASRTKRSRLNSLSNGAVKFEKFVDVNSVLREVRWVSSRVVAWNCAGTLPFSCSSS